MQFPSLSLSYKPGANGLPGDLELKALLSAKISLGLKNSTSLSLLEAKL